MRKKIVRTLIAVAASIPMTFMAVSAQTIYDEDISTYAQELDFRIEQGRNQLNDSSYQNLRNLWNKIEQIRRMYPNKGMNATERANMMASLINLDRQLTDNLHDDQNARFQNWDPNTKTWRQSWWKNIAQNFDYNDEIDVYQRELKNRMDSGRSSGRLTPAEFNRLNAQYNKINSLQNTLRGGGFSYSERNQLMAMLTQLDRDLTARLNDNDLARFSYWDSSKRSWNQQWWRPGWSAGGGGSRGAATASFNEEIDAYQRILKQRIDLGRSTGRITSSELRQLSASYDLIDQKQKEFRRGGFDNAERNQLMAMLTQLDRDVTAKLRDNRNSRYQQWDSKNNRWSDNWWKNSAAITLDPDDRMGDSIGFAEEINNYQRKLKNEINRGQKSGALTAAEVLSLNNQLASIEALQKQYRSSGFRRGERDTLMQRLKELERNITVALNNRDRIGSSEARDQWKDRDRRNRKNQ